MYAEDAGQTHTVPLIVGLVSISPYEPWLVDSLGHWYVLSLISLALTILPSPFLQNSPSSEYCRVPLGIISLIFSPLFLVYLRSLIYSASGSWSSMHYQGWTPSHDMGLKSDQSLVVHSSWVMHYISSHHILHAGKTEGKRFCGWAGVTHPSLEDLPGYRRWLVQAPYPPLLEIFSRVNFMDSWEFPLYRFLPHL